MVSVEHIPDVENGNGEEGHTGDGPLDDGPEDESPQDEGPQHEDAEGYLRVTNSAPDSAAPVHLFKSFGVPQDDG